ncbi:hypothetical protein [Galbibacter sp. PAP.153]|uniref:hypothetical protein n=1 Tax=Galbibacter sp. PAP.153 TaxID=3104623 RepID=UPI0030094266
MRIYFIVFLLFSGSFYIRAQDYTRASDFKEYYPIAERPYIMGGVGNNPYETMLFDAKPVVYYSFYNDIRKALSSDTITPGYAVYASFQPQLRMYNETSKPIKTPSYKILFGWQPIIKTQENNFLTLAIESGHYSNGQSKSAFSEAYDDESEESKEIYKTITDNTDLSEMLNRQSGNFSTNLTRLSINYRINHFDKNNRPNRIHSFTLAYQLYHDRFLGIFNFGGYNPEDIDIYGRHQLEFKYEYSAYWNKMRYVVGQDVFVHFGAHPSTEPYRVQSRAILFPWDTDLGFIAQFSAGFDDYNYRFVDSYARFSVGITWDWFTPFIIKPSKPKGSK